MPLTALVLAARHADLPTVQALLAAGADPREVCLAEPALLARQEAPLYATHALFEACRARSLPLIEALLRAPGVDVNQPATSLALTAYADACARGDAAVAAALLRDARCDAAAPCTGAAHPALLAAMTGSVPLLRVLAAHGALPLALAAPLLRTAAANGRPAALAFLQTHFIDAQPFLALTPGQQVVKVRREFRAVDADGNGFVDRGELGALLAALGLGLTTEEAREAFAALDTASDGRATLDQLCAYLLGERGWRRGLEELREAGGYAGESGALD